MQIRLPIPDAVRLELDTYSCSESSGRRPPCNDGAGSRYYDTARSIFNMHERRRRPDL